MAFYFGDVEQLSQVKLISDHFDVKWLQKIAELSQSDVVDKEKANSENNEDLVTTPVSISRKYFFI